MAVKLPKAAEITRTALEVFLANQSEITDVLPGTPEHDLIEKVFSEQVEGIFRKLSEVQDDFYIATATASGLNKKATDFSRTRKAALAAKGEAKFTGSAGSSIPKGTRIRRPAVSGSAEAIYSTDVADSIPASAPLDVTIAITAEDAGIIGNTSSGTIIEFVAGAPSGITAVTNPKLLDSGKEKESDEDLRKAIQEFFDSLRRGTVPSIEAAARRVNGVFRAKFLENDPFAGRGVLHLDTGSTTATDALIAEIKKIVLGDGSEANQGFLPAGTKIEVVAEDATTFDASIAVATVTPLLQRFNIPIYADLTATD